MFKVEWLYSLKMVVLHNGFTEAAKVMNCSAMSLSKQVSNLEGVVGEPLLQRSTRSISLTEFGEQFLALAEDTIEANERLHDWVRSRSKEAEGTIKVLSHDHSAILFIIPWVPEFLEKYPGIELEFDYVTDQIDLKKHTFDIAWGIPEYLGQLYPGLIRKKLFRITHGIFASPGYLKQYGTPSSPADLKSHKMIGYTRNSPNNRLLIKPTLESEEPFPYVDMNSPVKTTAGSIDFVVNGCGISNFSPILREVRDHVENNNLVPILKDYWWHHGDFYLYWHQFKGEQAKVRAFVDFFTRKLANWIQETEALYEK